jgi:diguanylate cyclase (GGDEF)-like protein/PAS domain S-box-containing protein
MIGTAGILVTSNLRDSIMSDGALEDLVSALAGYLEQAGHAPTAAQPQLDWHAHLVARTAGMGVDAATAYWQNGAVYMINVAALMVIVLGGMVLLGAWRIRKNTVKRKFEVDAALNNMQQGLLLFDAAGRLVLYNQRFLQMYRLSADSVKIGCTLSDLLQLRKAAGTFKGEPDRFVAKLVDADGGFKGDPDRQIARLYEEGRVQTKETELPDGRIIAITNQSTPGYGWVSVHEDITAQKRAEKAIQEAHANLREVVEAMPAGLVMYDDQDRLVLWNRRYDEIYPATADLRAPGVRFEDMLRAGVARGMYAEAVGRQEEWIAERLALHAEHHKIHEQSLGSGRWLRVEDYKTRLGGFIGIRVDITELKQREEELRLQNMKLDAALQHMSQGLVMFDPDRKLVFCNQKYADFYGLPPELMRPGITQKQILDHRVARGIIPKSNAEGYIRDRATKAAAGVESDTIVELSDGRTLSVVIRPTPNGGWVTTHEDITERRQAEARIAHMAHHDALTNLPNRVLLRERLEVALRCVAPGEQLAVLYLDLDHFKSVNDTLGHSVGDELLKTMADRLRQCIAGSDTIARLGGDEFAIIQTAVERSSDTADLARRIREAVTAPCDFGGHQVLPDVSIGISLAPNDSGEVDQLLKNADMALYRAKADGRGTYRFFEPEMDARMQARRALELDLRKALANNEFEVFYQPLVNLERNQVTSCEALLRWHHPQRGMISPVEFIPIAEETGFIVQIGEWVLAKACADAATWPHDIGVAVNVSAVQFRNQGLALTIVAALAASGLPAHRLEIEITETVLMQHNEVTLTTLHQLRDLGVRIAMDDFGTGCSSLSHLRGFPFDKIKIDRSFISDLSEQESVAIVRAVTGLAGSLRMVTTAEGVETQAQLDKIRALGCTEMQGYLCSRPVPAKDVVRFFLPPPEKVNAVA